MRGFQEPKKILQKLTGPVHWFGLLAFAPEGGSEAQALTAKTATAASSSPFERRAAASMARGSRRDDSPRTACVARASREE